MRKSHLMLFRASDQRDMQQLHILCQFLREKNNCFSITDTTVRGEPGYEVFWYIQNNPRVTHGGRRDRRFH